MTKKSQKSLRGKKLKRFFLDHYGSFLCFKFSSLWLETLIQDDHSQEKNQIVVNESSKSKIENVKAFSSIFELIIPITFMHSPSYFP